MKTIKSYIQFLEKSIVKDDKKSIPIDVKDDKDLEKDKKEEDSEKDED